MKKTKQYRSPLMASIQETAEGLHRAGLINKLTMRKFDAMSLIGRGSIHERKVEAQRHSRGAARLERSCEIASDPEPSPPRRSGDKAASPVK